MSKNEIQVNSKTLYDLVAAIAGEGTTISRYLPLCEHLWQNAQSRIWLIAALIRKAGMLTTEPDEACLEFLANKALHYLGCNQEKQVSKETVVKFLPAVIQLMPEYVWEKPLELWNELLRALKDEYDLKTPIKNSDVSSAFGSKEEYLARILVNAVGVHWDENLDKQLEAWENQTEFEWLSALKDSAQLEIMIDKVKEKYLIQYIFNDCSLFDKFSKMKIFEQRRLLIVRDTQTQKITWAEIEIENKVRAITWKFYLPLEREPRFEIYLSERLIGEINLIRQPSGDLLIEKTTGICMLLKIKFPQELTLKKAAADRSSELIPLMSMVTGGVKLVGDKEGLLILRWCAEDKA